MLIRLNILGVQRHIQHDGVDLFRGQPDIQPQQKPWVNQLLAGGGIILPGTTLIPLLSTLF